MYKKNTAAKVSFVMINKADGTAATGLAVVANLTIDGGVQGVAAGAVAEEGNGAYTFYGTAADFNGDHIGLLFNDAGAVAIPVSVSIATVVYNMTDLYNKIAAVSPQDHPASANTETTGTLDSGTYASTATVNNVYYQLSPVTPAVNGFGLDVYLTFNIGVGRIPSDVVVTGYFDAGASRTVQVWGYDYTLADWVQLSNSINDFGNTVANQTFEYAMTRNMVKTDGEVRIRFTSTSTTTSDNWYCDYVNVTSYAASASGLTADSIQRAVWGRSSAIINHDEHTLGYILSLRHVLVGEIVSVASSTIFVIDENIIADGCYDNMLIVLEDDATHHYETRRITHSYTGTNIIEIDKAVGFALSSGNDYYILGGAYRGGDVTSLDVKQECTDALTDYDAATVADVLSECGDALIAYDAATGEDVADSTTVIIAEVERMIPGTDIVTAGPNVVFRDSTGTGYDNSIQLSLQTQTPTSSLTAISMADVTAMEFSIPSIDLVIRNEDPSLGAIVWDEDITGAVGKVILSLGGEEGLPLGALIGWLITYNNEHPQGMVWGGASGIPFVVLEVPSASPLS